MGVSDIIIIVLILIGLIVDIFDIRYRRKDSSEDSKRDSESSR